MKRTLHPLLLLGVLLLSTQLVQAQSPEALAQQYLNDNRQELGLSAEDVTSWRVTDLYTNDRTGITYLYINQNHEGVDLLWSTANAVFNQEGRLVNMNVKFESDLAAAAGSTTATLTPEDALRACAEKLDLTVPQQFETEEVVYEPSLKTVFISNGWALENVPVRMVFYNAGDAGIKLGWEIDWYETSANHRWYVVIDAQNGELLYKRDQVIHCDFGHPALAHTDDCVGYAPRKFKGHKKAEKSFNLNPDSYQVFAMPIESPNHGPQSVVENPADPIASPYGWHDVDGEAGFEYTITRGNNVHAYQDTEDLDGSSGDEPDGGMELEFLFDYDQAAGPDAYQDAAVVNLFYWCNLMHDVWYQYGFDEQAGNFQENNYGNGGEPEDPIRAEAQDGSGTNNANFSSGGDGSGARIQMYLWTNSPQSSDFTVESPMNIAGPMATAGSNFGPGVPVDPLTDTLVLVQDATADPTFGCEELINGADVDGKIALIDRGVCGFVIKVLNAQDAGAVAAIICNDEPGDPITLGGASTDVVIPAIMISQEDCNLIKQELGNTVVGTLQQDGGTGSAFLDGDFDSGIISHEYGHGLSIRMTGGPSVGNCLGNAEQMGEGWSDYAGLMMTIEPGDAGEDVRGIGTFALGQSVEGNGIRPAPYSTDWAINDYTYAATNDNNNISQPHGIGFVWCTMLWDLTWDLIDVYGFDEDFYYGTGGNNIAMHLITEGMKMQICNPGFVDGRDAILLADEVFYNGANRCLIWEAFAERGLGWSADQGTSGSRTDQVEAFDLPPWCLEAIVPPTAQFSVNATESCSGFFSFTDESFDIPQEWQWYFGDGGESNDFDPTYTYTEEGTYTVQLIVTNTLGMDTATLEVVVDYPDDPVPTVGNIEVCEGETATLSADGDGQINWYQNGELVGNGSPFETPAISMGDVFEAEVEELQASSQGGPADNNFGTGGYHSTAFTGTVNFTATKPVVIESVFMDAGDTGERIIELLDGTGQVIETVSVFVEEGPGQVELNMMVPSSGNFALAATMQNLYRNDSGADYPYQVGDLVTLTGSSAGSDFYYYFYNWVVREASCFSGKVDVPVTVLEAPEAAFVTNQTEGLVDFTDQSVGAIAWSWEFGDGGMSDEQNPSYIYQESGTYTVTLTVSNGDCENSFSQIITVEVPSSVNLVEGLNSFNLYPNLGTGTFMLDLELERAENLQVVVYNTQGQEVSSRAFNNTRTLQETFELNGLPSGVYLVRVGWRDQGVTTRYVLIK
ncbi:MAG: PKD domain-containing protein [Bacteroidetes bacterium]|nr:PKD domain-containing protein [Bacteroidota bacterium]